MLTHALKRVPVESTYVHREQIPPLETEEPRSFWEKAAIVTAILVTFELALLALVGL